MRVSRRSFFCGAAALSFGTADIYAQVHPKLPRPDMFETGDLLWPRKPGMLVLYNQQLDDDLDKDRKIWEREREEFIRETALGLTSLTERQIAFIKSLSYREFRAQYFANQKLDEPNLYSSDSSQVGHVAIVDVDNSGRPYVIEALWGEGVVAHLYSEWLGVRPNDVVWLGRLKNRSKVDRAAAAEEAKKYLGRPYNFWDFNLNNDADFYCSKLIWLSVYRSIGIALDNNTNPSRAFWFSPKQLLHAPSIEIIHDPGV
jgi:hypothetical protein